MAITGPGDLCPQSPMEDPDDDCYPCKAQCGTCADGVTQWGCCGDCYVDYDANEDPICTGFKPRFCGTTTTTTTFSTTTTTSSTSTTPTVTDTTSTTSTSTVTCATLDCPDLCVDDIDGFGNAGCVSVDDRCDRPECYPPPPCVPPSTCPDGSCQGCCGCLWQYNSFGELYCSWYRQCPATTTTSTTTTSTTTSTTTTTTSTTTTTTTDTPTEDPCANTYCDNDEYCYTGTGYPECVAVGDTCDTCIRSLAPTRICDDGSCGGNCGCQYGLNKDGDIECQNYFRQCMEYSYYFLFCKLSAKQTKMKHKIRK